MNIFFYIVLFIFGTTFGSFSSVVIDRLKNNKKGIVNGRSECPKCNHLLHSYDLIPIFSFLSTGGKCRYCKTKISFMYPILEIVMGTLFVLTGYFLIDVSLIFSGDLIEIYKLFFYLLFGFFTIIYVVYDILYLEINEKILAIMVFLLSLTLILQSNGINILNTYNSFDIISIKEQIILFITFIFTIGGLYVIMLKGLDLIYDFIILASLFFIIFVLYYFLNIDLLNTVLGSSFIAVLGIFTFFFLQIAISGGKWLGGGDLRVGIVMGLILGAKFAFVGMFFTYIIGSILGLLFILIYKLKRYIKLKRSLFFRIKQMLGLNKEISHQIPFGPFLALGMYVVIFFPDYMLYLLGVFFK